MDGCRLDPSRLTEQLERYSILGKHATDVTYRPGELRARFADDVPGALVQRRLEVERGCCAFLRITYEPHERGSRLPPAPQAREQRSLRSPPR
jgi:hypothetical protein